MVFRVRVRAAKYLVPGVWAVLAVAVVLAAMSGIDPRRSAPAGRPPPPEPATAVPVNRLVRHGDDLYWTAGDSVYRALPEATSLRGRLIHRSPGATYGALRVAGTGQVFVVDGDRIVGIPVVPGAPARTVAVAPRAIKGSDLLTDGASLLWTDDRGVRAVRTSGGAVRTVTEDFPIQDLDLRDGQVIFAAGRMLKSVAIAGGAVTAEIVAANTITSVCSGADLYWTELGVEVHSRAGTLWVAPPGEAISDLSCDGGRVWWADRSHVYARVGSRTLQFPHGDNPHDFLGDGDTALFATSTGITRGEFAQPGGHGPRTPYRWAMQCTACCCQTLTLIPGG
jgi:hypothetical protein